MEPVLTLVVLVIAAVVALRVYRAYFMRTRCNALIRGGVRSGERCRITVRGVKSHCRYHGGLPE